MASILPEYEYDIFISYRHNDNLDGWVTDFVVALEKELKATLKNEVSIYFDKNPHVGLQETHVVDESLAKKLKCLVFIPIISQTYCDEKSFAWQHEFLAFNMMAKNDDLGMNISLESGNVARRILPIQIHEVDGHDQSLLESIIGPLRSINFIYQNAGVNRPLRIEDSDLADNQNKTNYRNQINKVANALKDIGTSILRNNSDEKSDKSPIQSSFKPEEKSKKGWLIGLAAAIAILLSYWGYTSISGLSKTAFEGDKSIAVLPFTKITKGEEVDAFSFGLHDDLLTQLSKLGELRVTSRTSVMEYENTKKNIRDIAQELDVSYILEGSIQQARNRIRLNVQLIGGETDEHIWAEVFDSEITLDNIFQIQSEISTNIARQLHMSITSEIKDELDNRITNNLDALQFYHKGIWLYDNYIDDLPKLKESMVNFQAAVDLDPNFNLARRWLIRSLSFISKQNSGDNNEYISRAKKELAYLEEYAVETKDLLLAKVYYEYYCRGNFSGAEDILLESDIDDFDLTEALAYVSRRLGKWDVYFKYMEESLIQDPRNLNTIVDLAFSYNHFRNYLKEAEYNERAIGLDSREGKAANFYMNAIGLGDIDEATKYHQSIKASLTSSENAMIEYWINYLNRDFQEAANITKNIPPFQYFSSDNYDPLLLLPSELMEAQAYWLLGDFGKSKSLVNAVADSSIYLHKIADCPVKPGKDLFGQDAILHLKKGYYLLFKGEVTDAREEAIHAQELYTSYQDPMQGSGISFISLRLLALCKDVDKTIPLIDHLLDIPSKLSITMLQVDPLYDYLRDNPDFNNLLKKYSK